MPIKTDFESTNMAESSDAASIADARRGNQQEEAAGNEVGTKANVSVARPSRERKRLERSALLHSMTVGPFS